MKCKGGVYLQKESSLTALGFQSLTSRMAGVMPSSDEGRGRERSGTCDGAGGGGSGSDGDEERVVAADASVKTPSSAGNESVSSDCQPKRALPLHRLSVSSSRVSVSDTSEPRPLVVTESDRA